MKNYNETLVELDIEIEELEEKIAPAAMTPDIRIVNNHNETLLHDKLDFEIEELEDKIAPSAGLPGKMVQNHNETLVQDE